MAGISRVHLMGSNLPPTWILPERLHLPCSLGPKSGLDQTVMGSGRGWVEIVPDHVGLVGQRRDFGFHSRGDRDGAQWQSLKQRRDTI